MIRQYFWEVAEAFIGTLKGLRVTLETLFKPAITVQYPEEKLVPYERFRGVLYVDIETCTACGMCSKVCPSGCIAMESAVSPAGKRIAKAKWYSIDLGKCNFCRLCEEACPTKPKSVWHSLDYELLFDNREEMVRYWRPGVGFAGECCDTKTRTFRPPKDHLQVQEVPARR